MKLEDLKDSNGTSLDSYATTLVEKAGEHSIVVTIIFAAADGNLHVVSPIAPAKLPAALKSLAKMFRLKPKL